MSGQRSHSGSDASSTAVPPLLYPLSCMVEDVLSQEGELWDRNEAMLQTLGVPASDGGEEVPDGVSVVSSKASSPPDTITGNGQQLIKYGQLTSNIHKYFRKLEKRHACLHLTARRAKHDTLRHVELSVHGSDPRLLSATSVLETEAVDGTLTELRDEERLVYRCALMCAQFPMLSAPDPPDGQSPSPPLPPLPARFDTGLLGSLQESDLSRTAPAEFNPIMAGVENGGLTHELPRDTPKKELNASVLSGGGEPDETGDGVDEVDEKKRPAASEPIAIKTSKPKRSLKRTLPKPPAGDSDSEDELTLINSGRSKIMNGVSGEREHPFPPMVTREMLCNLVRRSFSQTDEQQLMFEQALRQEHSRRSKGEILAKELASQLQVLENNAHPFYKPKFFVTRNGYDLWLQAEKGRVKNLIDKFWHFSIPRPQQWRHFSPTDYHRAYSTLLQKIITAESRTTRREPVYSGRTPSSPLSPTAHRLLQEFGFRYGVGELYRRIVYLDYLAKHFDHEIWYIGHCTEELRCIRVLLPRNRNKITAVRREMEMLRSTVHLLHGQTDNSLTRIDRLFLESDPKEGVACLIQLLVEVLDAEQSLFGKKVGPVEHWLKRYLRSGFALRYERRKVIATVETAQNSTAQPLSSTLVNSLLLDTREEILDYRDKYQEVFRPYFDIVPFSKLEFYRLLCSDACSLCAGLLHRPETRQRMSLEVLGLMYRLNERDLEWEGVISPGLQLWRRHFSDLALVWMEVLGKQIQKWVVESIAQDQWTLLTFSAHPRDTSPPTRYTPPTSTQRPSPRIINTIRTSPFPSPNPKNQERRSAFTPTPMSTGAFSPYSSYVGGLLKRTEGLPHVPSDEGSGAVTDSSSSQTTTVSMDSASGLLIGGGIPAMMGRLSEKPNTDSLLNFGLEGGGGLESSVASAHHIEVAVSVYSGCESDQDDLHLCQISSCPRTHPPDTDPQSRALPPVGVSEGLTSSTLDTQSTAETITKNDDTVLSGLDEYPLPSVGMLTSQADNTDPPALAVVHRHRKKSSPATPHDVSTSSRLQNSTDFTPSLSIDDIDPPKRLNNDDLLRPSGQMVGGGGSTWAEGSASTTDDHIPPASVGTVPELAHWRNTHPHHDSVAVNNQSLTVSARSSSPEFIDKQEANEMGNRGIPHDDDFDCDTPVRSLSRQSFQNYFFPVSNSPVDIVTMLTRLACFTGSILNVLTPRLPRSSLRTSSNPSHEYAPEVVQAREQAKLLLINAENNRTEFLKKMHRIMMNAMKLYADNLLCMDLCCFSGGEATKLVGEQKLDHLQRRKTAKEIWGCRHMVEAKHGLHPNGMPCQRKTSKQFESITRDMCIRINNMHTLITTFPSLENHLYSSMRTSTQAPATAHGYISSDPGELDPRHAHSQSHKPNPHSTRPPSDRGTLRSNDMTPLPSSISPSLGPMEPDGGRGRKELPDVGFRSKESQQVLEYLRSTHTCQLKLLCLRLNKFFKPALSLLLELKLVNYPLDKRLLPLITFLERHRLALKKYLYPASFNTTMELLWECILQDLEGEAVQLRSRKRPVTDRAQMLLQVLSILMEFMHHKNEGLPLDILTGSSGYLLGLLDVMTRSTDQLMLMFNKLSAPQFSSGHDLSQSPVPIDGRLLQCLRNQLHRFKKCFTGKEFVDKVLEVGELFDFRSEPSSNASTPIQVAGQAGISLGGQPVEYTVRYATELAQFLLRESMLIELPSSSASLRSGASFTPAPSTDDERSLGESLERHDMSDGLSAESQVSISSQRRTGGGRLEQQAVFNSYSQRSASISRSAHQAFSNNQCVFYKFADSQDTDSNSLYQSHILAASTAGSQTTGHLTLGRSLSRSTAASLQEEHREFTQARQGTLFLVYDLLVQRGKKERRAKQFLQTPRALEVVELRRRRNVDCNLIFKM